MTAFRINKVGLSSLIKFTFTFTIIKIKFEILHFYAILLNLLNVCKDGIL